MEDIDKAIVKKMCEHWIVFLTFDILNCSIFSWIILLQYISQFYTAQLFQMSETPDKYVKAEPADGSTGRGGSPWPGSTLQAQGLTHGTKLHAEP